MNFTFSRGGTLAIAAAALCLSVPASRAAQMNDPPPTQTVGVAPSLLRKVGLDQELNQQVPLDLVFRNERGESVALRQFFGRGPVILTLVYYQCPMLCTEVLNGLVHSLNQMPLELGKDFSVVTLSIDPKDMPKLAAAKHEIYTGLYAPRRDSTGWYFLTGDESNIKRLAGAVGFRYAYDPASGQYAHPSALMVLTPDGKISRYFYGIDYPQRDLRWSLIEAAKGKIGSPVDQLLLYCFHYDPNTGKYGILVSRVLQICGGLTVLGIAILVAILFRRENYGYRRPA